MEKLKIDENLIENELIKKIDKKNQKNENQIKAIKDFDKENLTNDEIDTFQQHLNKLSIQNNILNEKNLKTFNYFNQKFGEYTFVGKEKNNFSIQSQISKNLHKAEILDKLFPDLPKSPKEIDLELDLNFNFRFFKYLESYNNIFFNSSDIVLRQELLSTYIFHILNHISKRKEQIQVNDAIHRLYNLNIESTKTQLKETLFENDDLTFLNKYNNELISYHNDYFKEFKIKNYVSMKTLEDIKANTEIDELVKDQGFTSPKVLILCPFKKHAKILIEEMVNILFAGDWKGVGNKKKFNEEFEEAESMNDCFRLGITFDAIENKIKLYTSFDESDIIVCSPLGLKLANTSDNVSANNKVYDFLSSIEIVLMDFSEIFLYQNIQHLEEILSFVNKMPKNNQNINDIYRIMDVFKENKMQNLRQSIVISHFKSVDLEMIYQGFFQNSLGTYKFYEKYKNILVDFNQKDENDLNIKFEFKILKYENNLDILDNKYNFFVKNVITSFNPLDLEKPSRNIRKTYNYFRFINSRLH